MQHSINAAFASTDTIPATAPAPSEGLRIVYVVSHGRSGSTLVGSVLGMLDDFCFVGEVRTAWEDGVHANRNCGCGRPFRECPFWTTVFDDAYGGFDTPESLAAEKAIDSRHPPREAVRLWSNILGGCRQLSGTDEYVAALLPLYRAIHRACGGRVIVDSSKQLRYGRLLAAMPQTDIRYLNLVRDVRSVVQSRARPALMRDGQARHAGSDRPRYRVLKVTSRWIVRNEFGMRLVRTFGGLRVRYEEFAANPVPTLAALTGTTGAARAMVRLESQTDTPAIQHQLAGNWVRGLRLQVRETWRRDLPPPVRALTSALAWPFLRRYRFEVHRAGGLSPQSE